MNIVNISNLDIDELRVYKTLRGNIFDKDGSFVADSPKVVLKLLQSNLKFKSLLCTQEFIDRYENIIKKSRVPTVYIGKKSILEQIVGHKIHHNVMLHALRPAEVELENLPPQAVMLSNPSNMENVGAIARSAVAFGVGGYIVPKKGPHPFGRRAIRVATGHTIDLKIHTFDNAIDTINRLKKLGYSIISAELTENSIDLGKYRVATDKWVLVMGNEEDGIPQEILNISDATLQIEISPTVKSLNVAIASSIILYKLTNS